MLLPDLPRSPRLPQVQPPLPQPLKLTMNLILLERNPVRLLRLGPEVRHREAIVEVRAVVVHDCDWKHDVHAKLHLVSIVRTLIVRDGIEKGKQLQTYFEDFEIRTSHFEVFCKGEWREWL